MEFPSFRSPHPPPTPAIVTAAAVRPLPRWALWLLCLAYVVPGYMGRGPWKSEDVISLGVMLQLAEGASSWWNPSLLGHPLDNGAVLLYSLGALCIQWLSPGVDPAMAARLPAMAALSLVLYFTWQSVFRLALLPHAQPVAFAFGGQARPVDYARALADSSLMALMACLGLAQLSHETSPELLQLASVSALLYASSLSAHGEQPGWRLPLLWWGGLAGLSLSGLPWSAVVVAFGLPMARSIWSRWWQAGSSTSPPWHALHWPHWAWSGLALTLGLLLGMGWMRGTWVCEACAWTPPGGSFGKLLLWFTWPAGPLALWTLWQWRRHLLMHHLSIPWVFALGVMVLSFLNGGDDRLLMLALPPLAALAAFALPTLRRSFSSLMDWFSVLFFSSCAALIWVIWIAMMTGVPAKPAANVARLAPGFTPSFEGVGFIIALMAVLAWAWVVRWRISHAPAFLWKSLVLPATGSIVCWLLLMTLWLPLLDHSRSYAFLSQRLLSLLPASGLQGCMAIHRLSLAQQAGLLYHGKFDLQVVPAHTSEASPSEQRTCALGLTPVGVPPPQDGWHWQAIERLYRLTDNKEGLQLYKRSPSPHPPLTSVASMASVTATPPEASAVD